MPLKFTTRQLSAEIVDFSRREWACPSSTATWRDTDGPTSRARQRAMTSTAAQKSIKNLLRSGGWLSATAKHCRHPSIYRRVRLCVYLVRNSGHGLRSVNDSLTVYKKLVFRTHTRVWSVKVRCPYKLQDKEAMLLSFCWRVGRSLTV